MNSPQMSFWFVFSPLLCAFLQSIKSNGVFAFMLVVESDYL